MAKARDAHPGADAGAPGAGAFWPILRDPPGVQCHTQRVTTGSNLDGGFAVTAQEPGCCVRRARDPESEHKVGDKLLSLGCYTSAFSSLGILSPRPPTRIYTTELRVTFILVKERTKFLRFDGQLRVDLKRKPGSILFTPSFY